MLLFCVRAAALSVAARVRVFQRINLLISGQPTNAEAIMPTLPSSEFRTRTRSGSRWATSSIALTSRGYGLDAEPGIAQYASIATLAAGGCAANTSCLTVGAVDQATCGDNSSKIARCREAHVHVDDNCDPAAAIGFRQAQNLRPQTTRSLGPMNRVRVDMTSLRRRYFGADLVVRN
jgi:hypothetical protein